MFYSRKGSKLVGDYLGRTIHNVCLSLSLYIDEIKKKLPILKQRVVLIYKSLKCVIKVMIFDNTYFFDYHTKRNNRSLKQNVFEMVQQELLKCGKGFIACKNS